MGSQKIKRKAECLPWKIPFEYRVRLLFQNHVNGFKNVVYLYEIADTSTFRYRAYNMCQALDESLYWRGSYFFETELERLKPYLKYIEVVIAVRFHWSDKLGDLFFALKALGIKVLFDVDDLVFEIKYFSELLESIGIKKESEMEVAFWKKYVTGLNHTAALCDGGITTNAYLARYLEEITGKGSFVIPNTFNSWQERISDELWRKKNEKTNKKENSDFILGYFSGSYTHEKDFAMIAEEVRDLLYAIPEMKLRVVGYMKLPDYMDSLIKEGKIEFLPYQNFVELQETISKVDINLVPLEDTIFTNCKSELKYFESSIVGTVSCMSPTYIYREIIKSGENGFLCSKGEWYEIIMKLYMKHIDETPVVKNAYTFSVENYRYSVIRKSIEDCCNKMMKES